MPYTTVQEYLADPQTTLAEVKLIKACQAGIPCILEDGTLPPEGTPTPERRVRAELLRLLIMGGTTECRLHPSGVWLEGAHVLNSLDLRFVKALGRCVLDRSRFDETLFLTQTEISQLSLEGSYVPGLFAQGIKVEGDIFLRNITVKGTINLSGSKIGGQLSCEEATLEAGDDDIAFIAQSIRTGASIHFSDINANGTIDVSGGIVGGQLDFEGSTIKARVDVNGLRRSALHAQAITVEASVYLRNLTTLGTVTINGARIGGQLECSGANLSGKSDRSMIISRALNAQGTRIEADFLCVGLTASGSMDLNGAKIGRQLNFQGASLNGYRSISLNGETSESSDSDFVALFGRRLEVGQGFIFRDLNTVSGIVYLDTARLGDLIDDAESWQKSGHFINGLTYERVGGPSPLTLTLRQDWLYNGSRFHSFFFPQPYTQFAKVLREMGHASEARKVLMERDRLLFAENHKTNLAALNAARMEDRSDVGKAWLRYHLLRFWAWFSFTASGYGHAPQRALFLSLKWIGFGAIWFYIAWQAGVMVPNSAIILTSPDWLAAMASAPDHPSAAWTVTPSGTHYETFYALPYALDVFTPFLTLGQESAWAATTIGWWAWATRIFTFIYQIVGWSITALGIAAITGFVQKNQPD